MYTIVLVNVKRFRALCGFYAIENKLLLLLLLMKHAGAPFNWMANNVGQELRPTT